MSSTIPTPNTAPGPTADTHATTWAARRTAERLRRLAGSTTAALLITAAASLAMAGPAQAGTDSAASPAMAPAAYTSAAYYWGAIAYSPSTGAAGYTYDYPSSSTAARAAVAKCGVADCQSVVEVANGCASLAQADNYALGWAYGASRADSDATARRYAAGPHPRIVGWVCTTGHR